MILYCNKILGRLSFGLSRVLWAVQLGVFLNMLGYGAVLPFEVIYLHDVRHFSLAVAGLVVATVTTVAIAAALPAGALIDRLGARATAVVALVLMGGGYAGLALAARPWLAFACAAVTGVGQGWLSPSQLALVATLVSRELRHRATAVSRVCVNVGIALGGGLGGLIASTGSDGLRALFLINAGTYVVYAALLRMVVPAAGAARSAVGGSYRRVVADRPFVALLGANVVFIAVGWGVLAWVVPVYAKSLGVGGSLIGALLLVNGATVVVAQLPIVRGMEGRRRVVSIALAGLLFAGGCAAVALAQPLPLRAAAAVLLSVAVVMGIGECLYLAALTPLIADLAPTELMGRYMACFSISWSLGLAAAPAIFTPLVGVSPTACFVALGAAAIAAVLVVRAVEPRLPVGAAVTEGPSRRV